MNSFDKKLNFEIAYFYGNKSTLRKVGLDLRLFDWLSAGNGVNVESKEGFDFVMEVAQDSANANAFLGCKGVVVCGNSPWYVSLVF